MRYTVPGVPAGVPLSAVAPHFTRMAASGAIRYKAAVQGSPGTTRVPAPTRDTVPSPDIGDRAGGGLFYSTDAPDFWLPTKYYERSLDGDGTMGPTTPVRIYSDNLMPVPAVDPRGRPARLARPILQRGQWQISAPRAVPAWGGGGV